MSKDQENQEEILDSQEEEQNSNSNDNEEDETADANSQKWSDDNIDYKKRYSDSSRENSNIRNTFTAYRDVLKDNSKLLDLNKDIWKKIVEQLYEDWYTETDDYDELISIIKWEEKPQNKEIDEEKLTKRIRQQIIDEQNEEAANKVLDKALKKYDSDVKDKYLNEFKETVGKRKLTPELAEKEINKIILYYNKKSTSKSNKNDDVLSKLASNNLWGSNTKSATTMTIAKLDAAWVPKDRQKTLYPELFSKKS